ncbi:hypothetical protein [Tenacibaculum sp. C7A-26P2]|uniref:hypothetical protein n=1 Tax=Tenacibaculum sp. C7A-26P2 TaxID=3447504 RepID=UPI003F82E8CC
MESKQKTDILEFFLKKPLYSEFDLYTLRLEETLSILFFHEHCRIGDYHIVNKFKTIDSYCTVCNKETTFTSSVTDLDVVNQILRDPTKDNVKILKILKEKGTHQRELQGVYQRVFKCPRPESNSSHDQVFIFRVKDSKIIKVGQSPSIADLSKKEIAKYRALKEDIYQELNKAIGLASHGIGVGSFVYLRRIIEKHIVSPKLDELLNEQSITQEEIDRSDFKSKIKLVKSKTPDFLVENRKIYSILSKGIHELEENECKDFFPILNDAIQIILDEEIERKEREKKRKSIADKLSKIN